MISKNVVDNLIHTFTIFWTNHAQHSEEFRRMLLNKEPGHSISDYVDKKTTEYILLNFQEFHIKFENNKRSMGDFWVSENLLNYTPVNIKTGVILDGSPNIVSLKKLLQKLATRQIDSYYLFVIKFIRTNPTETLQHNFNYKTKVCFFNLLDYLKYTNYDAGPGQIMLKEKDFYSGFDQNNLLPHLDLADVLTNLLNMQKDALATLISNRNADLESSEQLIKEFVIDNPLNQDELDLV